ncbi:MAG TPA: hypothetical protein VHD58_10370 [Mycobacteriales bacterium]|nr:hypothetical protein [Mycobacteriales bacterium]HVU62039.1 hypothetical protein [Mycobacteriales bacterium]
MTLDEKALAEALQAIDAEVAPDLAARARTGGRRRLLRRRSLTAAGAVAVGAAAAPVTLAVRAGLGTNGGGGPIEVGASSSTSPIPALYATPPAAGSECNGGDAQKVPATAHPDMLLLPPAEQQVKYAYVRDQTWNCSTPHVALTLVQKHGDSIGAGLVVEGPNARTPAQDGRQGPNIEFGGDEGHLSVDGQPATEFSLGYIEHTDVYWTEPDGGQWHAIVRNLSQTDGVKLLNRMTFDGRTGTATLPNATADWTVVARDRDPSPDETGVMMAQWTDPQGHLVDLTVTQTPDRTYQDAVESGARESIIMVRGRPAVLAPGGGNGGNAFGLTWQEVKDVEVRLAITGGTASEIKQVAESLVLASADDPRISKD